MLSINKVMLSGNLTRDPELKQLASGSGVASFSIACNRRYKVNGEQREDVAFVECEAWGKTADTIAQYCTKGKPIYIEGRLQMDQWADQNGNKRTKLKVVVESFQFVPTGEKRDAQYSQPPSSAQVQRSFAEDDSEPPF